MTTRPEHPYRARARRLTAAAVLATAGLTLPFAHPAEAAVPVVANSWSTLMYRSLTVDAQIAQLRTTLAAQQTTFNTRVGEVAEAKIANGGAQARLTAATGADTTARAQLTTAVEAATAAKQNLTKATKVKPRNAAAVTKATGAVTAAVKTVNLRKAAVERASGVLKQARTGAQSATTALTSALAAWKTASGAITVTQQRITAVPKAADLAGQGAKLSKDVVNQVRPAFTTADTAQVYGVTVHKNVAYAFKRMVDDAKADGIAISGGGFRTKQRQIELRTINGCPDVWTAPASSCRVPTAIPGRSLHEIGMAVDITSGGKTLTSKSTAFAWLKVHAAQYGFVNLPAEAWHWSITGG
ncbi:M15 family metallopeptidase [Paractinoplanes toevensis]|uniref:M15 family metallopeptidase n=1 Tax=Paractinoplanes toevensis TaxID=571911 RepID=UPI001FE3F1A8|nr:M15 family metallopeptidase [Actinoplanes toevensis]